MGLMGQGTFEKRHNVVNIETLSVTEKACADTSSNALEQTMLKVLQNDSVVLAQDISSVYKNGLIAINEDKDFDRPIHHPDRMLRFYNVQNEISQTRWFLSQKDFIKGVQKELRPYIVFENDSKKHLKFSAFLGCRPIIGTAIVKDKTITFSYKANDQILPNCRDFTAAPERSTSYHLEPYRSRNGAV